MTKRPNRAWGLFIAIAAALSLAAARPARAGDLSPSVPRFNPRFPVFGGGKFVNIFDSDAALTNASAHVAWSLAIPFAGESIGGRKGKWIAGSAWIALTVVQESLFHAPQNPGPGYPAEVRADLITRLVPTMLVLGWDLVRGGGGPARRIEPAVPRGPLREGTPVRAASDAPPPFMCPDVPAPRAASL